MYAAGGHSIKIMKTKKYLEIRIDELTARRRYAADYVLNRELQHEVKMLDVQIAALQKHLHPDDSIAGEAVRVGEQLTCAHRWNVTDGGLVQDGHELTCEKCGARKSTEGGTT